MLLLNLLDDLKLNVQDAIISHNMNKNIDRYNKAVYESCEYKVAHMNLTEKIGELSRIINEIIPEENEFKPNLELFESYALYLVMLLKSSDVHDFVQKLVNTACNDPASCITVLDMLLGEERGLLITSCFRDSNFRAEFGFVAPTITYQNDYSDMIQDIDYTRDEVFNILVQKAKDEFPEYDIEKIRSSIEDLIDQIIEHALSVSDGELDEQFMLNGIGSKPEIFFDKKYIKEKIGIDLEDPNEEESENPEAVTAEDSTEEVEVKNETEPIIVDSKATIIEETPIAEPKPVETAVDEKETLKTPDFIADEPTKEEQAQSESPAEENKTEETNQHVKVDHQETFDIIKDNIEKDAHSFVDKVMKDYVENEKPKAQASRKTNPRKKR